MDFSSLPKIELHLHLDCSLSYEVVKQLDPSVTSQQFREEFVAGGQCHNLNDYLLRALKGIALMQTSDQLEAVTRDLFRQLKKDGVIYAEIRFAPLQHLENGLTAQEVVQIVDAAMEKCMAKTGVEARMILCTLRHFNDAESMKTVELVKEFKGTTVAGFDIAADEAGFPIDNHIAAFRYAKDHGLGITAHAGEACGPESVWETLEHFQPSRIGHGIRSIEDAKLIRFLKNYDVHLEICPTSNIKTHIYSQLKDHPVDRILKEGVNCSISTDGRTISDISLSHEYQNLHQNFNWGIQEFLQCNLQAIDAAFLSEKIKIELRQEIRKAYR